MLTPRDSICNAPRVVRFICVFEIHSYCTNLEVSKFFSVLRNCQLSNSIASGSINITFNICVQYRFKLISYITITDSSGRVLIMPLKSHGRLYDVTVSVSNHSKLTNLAP